MTTTNGESGEDKVRNYRAGAIHYMSNAHSFLARQEFTKTSEFLWGAMAQAVKAVAALNLTYQASPAPAAMGLHQRAGPRIKRPCYLSGLSSG
jgi:hypothetical protein